MDVYGLIGNPVGHSLSPPMHEAAYRTLDLDARYVTFEPDPDAIESVIAGAEALGIAGLNVTIPFKETVLDFVEPDPLSSRIGAVNTIDFTGSSITGHNTDAVGARRALERHDVDVGAGTAVIVGAGGAARAIAAMLADAGMTISIVNRTEHRAHALADNHPNTSGYGMENLPEVIDGASVLINATSVGMESDESPVQPELLHAGLTVMDAVYRPVETRLLREAAARGARTIDGVWMLLYQGVESFERWTGKSAPVDTMDAAIRARV